MRQKSQKNTHIEKRQADYKLMRIDNVLKFVLFES